MKDVLTARQVQKITGYPLIAIYEMVKEGCPFGFYRKTEGASRGKYTFFRHQLELHIGRKITDEELEIV